MRAIDYLHKHILLRNVSGNSVTERYVSTVSESGNYLKLEWFTWNNGKQEYQEQWVSFDVFKERFVEFINHFSKT